MSKPSHWADQEGNTVTAELKAYNESRGGAPKAASATYTEPLYRHPPTSVAADGANVPLELAGVAQQLREKAGFWSSCSGCYESEDGHPMGDYIYSAALECTLGAGCSECGGLGAVWDNADYEGMIQTWLEDAPMPEQQVDVTMINAPRALLERIETWMPEHCQDLTDLQALLNAQPTASPAPTINAGKDTTCNQ